MGVGEVYNNNGNIWCLRSIHLTDPIDGKELRIMCPSQKNFAAILPFPKAPPEVEEVIIWNPNPDEILVRNELIAINPVEYKIAKLGIMPLNYPAIIGSTFTGTIEAVGSRVIGWTVGERVVVSKRFGVKGNQYGAWQRFVVVKDKMVTRIGEMEMAKAIASIMMNATCVPGLLTGRIGFEKPELDRKLSDKGVKVLIYGGSSSFGRLAIRYLSQAGYSVVTTASSRTRSSVSELGAAKVVDHTFPLEIVKEHLLIEGPYAAVIDMISLPSTFDITTRIVEGQGGGKLYVTQPPSNATEIPKSVECVFEPWSDCLYEEGKENLLRWVVEDYLPKGIAGGLIVEQDTEMVGRGLLGIDEALGRVGQGEGSRIAVDPWVAEGSLLPSL